MKGLRFIFDDLLIKLFSLGVSLLLFLFVSVENSTPVDVDFRIEYRTADDILITNSAPTVLHTTLQGPWASFRAFEMAGMAPVVVDLLHAGPGSVRHNINLTDIRAPGGMRVASMRPSELEVVLDRRVERQVTVHADVSKAPAFGYEILDVRVVPAKVRVVGPGSRMQALEYISTRTIDIDGREQELSLEVDLRPPPPPLRLLDKRVMVFVEIAEEMTQRTLQNVPVVVDDAPKGTTVVPERVAFVLKGPRRLIEGIHADDLRAHVEFGPADSKSTAPMERAVALDGELPERAHLVAPVPRVIVTLPQLRKPKKK